MNSELLITAWKNVKDLGDPSQEVKEAILDLISAMTRDLVGPDAKIGLTPTTLIMVSYLWIGIEIGKELSHYESA